MIPHDENLAVADADQLNDASEKLAGSLRRMAQELPDRYKQAIMLTDFEGMKQTEVAKKLGISLSGVKSRVQRARKMLKELLLECCHVEFDRYGTVFDYHPKDCKHCCGDPIKASCN
jgi:RNA polymerase sigma-70 factor (ECF subfamily)